LTDHLGGLTAELAALALALGRAYRPVEAPVAFRTTLGARLRAEGRRLNAAPPRRQPSWARRLAVGAVAVTVAGGGLALVVLRNRLGSLASPSMTPLASAESH
jgi:hypothetical protein